MVKTFPGLFQYRLQAAVYTTVLNKIQFSVTLRIQADGNTAVQTIEVTEAKFYTNGTEIGWKLPLSGKLKRSCFDPIFHNVENLDLNR